MNFAKFIVLVLTLVSVSCSLSVPQDVEIAYEELPETIDFNFHVKPILSDRCYASHGPDKNTRKADLRLDLEVDAFSKLSSGNYAIVSKNPSKSESLHRILSDDPELTMPPSESHLKLSAAEKATILKWIEQGAEWKNHWAYIKPEKPDLPEIKETTWKSHNPIDNFIQKKLVEKSLKPSIEADKERLLRRVTMDLTGLPPTITEIEHFLKDKGADAYESVVDELLATDAYAERLTLDWMDISRYADSHGLHADGWRLMWPWRDWVIKSFKDNMPYDQFVTWQLAGDLLPNASKVQCKETDQATAALITDLKQRGMFEDTLVIWGGEFGRTNYSQGKLTPDNFGRDHHPKCFTIFMAGAGIKKGFTLGATDDFGYNVVQRPVHIHDFQATLMHLLGVDHERLTFKFQGRRYRLTDVHGEVVNEILA
ncbi:MAG: DUF1501 domain-containing protein [Maribacter sp.]|nr:DUF1501 domain-containing protein [Maribacter sp.]